MWSSKDESWKGLLSEVDLDSWSFPFRLVTNKLRGLSGPLTTGMTEEFLAEVIAELFPGGFPLRQNSRRRNGGGGSPPLRRGLEEALGFRPERLAFSASLSVCCVRVSRRDTVEGSEPRVAGQTG